MADEAAMARLIAWCREEKSKAEQSLGLMKAGKLRLFRGPAHDQASDITDEQIADCEKIIREMDGIIAADDRRKVAG